MEKLRLIASAGVLSGLRKCMLANKSSVDIKVGDQDMILGHFPLVPVYRYCLL